jgi:REP element-mobilizing transposase RayT
MVTHMKITIDITDPMLEAAKKAAAREGTIRRTLVELGLRQVLKTMKGAGAYRLSKASFRGERVRAWVRSCSNTSPVIDVGMARLLRLELSGGVNHVTSRGDRREDIYLGDVDREAWLAAFGQVCERFNWVCHAWCQMTKHYHLQIEIPVENLAQSMRALTGVYTQRFNRAHASIGHVFQGCYKTSWLNMAVTCWNSRAI